MSEYTDELRKFADTMTPEGPLAEYPKLARAWLFYKYEPREFRKYETNRESMVGLLKKIGIDATESTIEQYFQDAENMLFSRGMEGAESIKL